MNKYRIKYYPPYYFLERRSKWLWVFPVWKTVSWHWDLNRIQEEYSKLINNDE